MKKRRMEFIFVIIIIMLGSIVIFTDIPKLWKALCLTLYGVIIMITIFSLLLENRSAQSTLLWIYVLLFLPVLGYIFYLYSGQLLRKGYLFRTKRIKNREVFETLKRKTKIIDTSMLNDHQRCFAQYLGKLTVTDTNTKTKILKNGEETFREIKRQLKEAKSFIHMEYFIFRYDRLGKEIVDILIEKVQEGI